MLYLMFLVIALSFVICTVLTKITIPFLRKLNFGQSIRKEGPQEHQKKSGTPTMGGIVIISSVVFSTVGILLALFYDSIDSINKEVLLALFLFVGYGLVGFADDYIKVVKKRNLGLTSKQKLLGQMLIATVFVLFIGDNTTVWVPIVNITLDIGIFYYLLVFCLLIGTTNAVNLTDGLDGLAAGTVIPVALSYLIIALYLLNLPLAIFAGTIIGSLLGFLLFNFNPAKVFMGDTGSLALGGGIAALALLTKTEWLLVFIGGLFVLEALSVILQVISFKSTGKRIFKMSPIHHHFELNGWSERKVVLVFWLVSSIFSFLGLYIWFM